MKFTCISYKGLDSESLDHWHLRLTSRSWIFILVRIRGQLILTRGEIRQSSWYADMLNILCFTGVFEPSPLMHEFIHPQYYHSVRMGVLWKSVFVHKGTKKCNNCTTQYPNVPIPKTMTWGCWFEEHQNQMANSNSIRPEDHLRSCNFDVSEALCNINLLLLLFHWSATMFECFDQGIFTTIHSVPLSSVHSNFWGPGLHILQLLDCFLDPPWNLGRFPAIFRDNPTIYFH